MSGHQCELALTSESVYSEKFEMLNKERLEEPATASHEASHISQLKKSATTK